MMHAVRASPALSYIEGDRPAAHSAPRVESPSRDDGGAVPETLSRDDGGAVPETLSRDDGGGGGAVPETLSRDDGGGGGALHDEYPRGGTVSLEWFRALCAARGFAAASEGMRGRSSRVLCRGGEVMKVQYLVQQPYEDPPRWLTMQLFEYGDGDADGPDPEAVALLMDGDAPLTREQTEGLRDFAAAAWDEEVEAMQRASEAIVTPEFLGCFLVENPRAPDIRLGVTVQRRARVVWGQYDDAGLARRACQTGLKPLLRIVTDTARAGLCHPDINVGNICEHGGRLMLLDWADALPAMTDVTFSAEGLASRDAVTEEWRVLMMLRSLMKQFRWIEQHHPRMMPRLHTEIVAVYTRRRREFLRRLRRATDPDQTDYANIFYSAYD